jgi:hypothetical protein
VYVVSLGNGLVKVGRGKPDRADAHGGVLISHVTTLSRGHDFLAERFIHKALYDAGRHRPLAPGTLPKNGDSEVFRCTAARSVELLELSLAASAEFVLTPASFKKARDNDKVWSFKLRAAGKEIT